MADMKEKIKEHIDAAADKAKSATDKAVDKSKEATRRAGWEVRARDVAEDLVATEDRLLSHQYDAGVVQGQAAQLARDSLLADALEG